MRLRNSTIKSRLIGAITGMVVGAIIGAGFCIMTGSNLSERSEEMAAMMIFLLVEAMMGGFFGMLFWAAIESNKAQKSRTRFQKTALRGKIFISVAPQTNEDAIEVARQWQNISDRILQH